MPWDGTARGHAFGNTSPCLLGVWYYTEDLWRSVPIWGLLSAISVLNPGMSTSYVFLPKLLCNKMSYWHLNLNLSKTNVLLTPTCSCSGVPSIEENSYRTLSHCHNKPGSESCGFRQFFIWNIPPNHSPVFILTDCLKKTKTNKPTNNKNTKPDYTKNQKNLNLNETINKCHYEDKSEVWIIWQVF